MVWGGRGGEKIHHACDAQNLAKKVSFGNDIIDRAARGNPSTVTASCAGTRIGGKNERSDFDMATSNAPTTKRGSKSP